MRRVSPVTSCLAHSLTSIPSFLLPFHTDAACQTAASSLTLPTPCAKAIFPNYLHAHRIPSSKTKPNTNQPLHGPYLPNEKSHLRPFVIWLQASFPIGTALFPLTLKKTACSLTPPLLRDTHPYLLVLCLGFVQTAHLPGMLPSLPLPWPL